MTHLRRTTGLILISMLALPASAKAAESDPRVQSGNCPARGPAIEVRVAGLSRASGKVRVQAYSGGGFLSKGHWLARAEVEAKGRSLTVCLMVREPGRYAIAVRHDANNNGKPDWNDGAGFSRNPRISLLDRPRFEQVSIPVGAGPNPTTIIMNYRRGWSIGPLSR